MGGLYYIKVQLKVVLKLGMRCNKKHKLLANIVYIYNNKLALKLIQLLAWHKYSSQTTVHAHRVLLLL